MLAALLFVAEIGLIIVAAITCLKIGWVCDIYIQEHKKDKQQRLSIINRNTTCQNIFIL